MTQAPIKKILTFDVGGTNVRAGIYCPQTRFLSSVERVCTPSHQVLEHASGAEICRLLFKTIARLGIKILRGNLPSVIVFSFPGPVDPQGYALAAPTIWGARKMEPVNLKDSLREIWPSAKIFVLNDVTAAGYRYIKHADDSLCVTTISSGIGCKVFVKGRVLIGRNGWGGEIGHVRVDPSPNAPVCECGGVGHLGALASGRATIYQARRLFESNPEAFDSSALGRWLDGDVSRVDNKLIVQFYKRGDSWTKLLIQKIAQPVGQILATLHLAIGLERFVIIGGFALALGESYRLDLVNASTACAWNLSGDWNKMIELGVADDNSGLIGAGYYGAVYNDLEQQ